MKNKDLFLKNLKEIDLIIDNKQLDKFNLFMDEMKKWNSRVRLTSITDNIEIINKHFVDSLSVLKSNVFRNGQKVFDLGTGGGFPGIPLKIYDESIELTMLDSRLKKVEYLEHIIEKFNLNDTYVFHGRAEEFGQEPDFREMYDVVVSRAVANLAVLSEYCLPFLKINGYFIAMKGSETEDELSESKKAIKTLGGKIIDVIVLTLPNTDYDRTLIVIKKIKKTPKKFPRSPGKPKMKPIKG